MRVALLGEQVPLFAETTEVDQDKTRWTTGSLGWKMQRSQHEKASMKQKNF